MAEDFYTGKTVLITGASTGIGRAMASELSRRGARLILLARRYSLLEELASSFSGAMYAPLLFKCDVGSTTEVHSVFENLRNNNIVPDICILNAAVSFRPERGVINTAKAEETMNINYLGVLRCAEEILPAMQKRGIGVIVAVSSLADARGFPRSGYYTASKAALTKAMEALRNEVKTFGVKVITVRPGFISTPMVAKNNFPMPFLMNAEKAATVILAGIERGKHTIQFPLPMVLIVRLLRVIPDGLFNRLSKFSK